MNDIGSVTLSLDTELGWGAVTHNDLWLTREKAGVYENLRLQLKKFLDLLDVCNFPCTWAFVGAMIDINRDVPFPSNESKERITKAYRAGKKSSFDGRDIFEAVLRSKVQHEIAWHSYYHIPYDVMDTDYAKIDLKKAQELARLYDIEMSSLVFPCNIEKHHDVMTQMGIKICRIRENKPFFCNASKSLNRLYKLYLLLFSVPPKSVIIQKNTLLCATGSMLLTPPFYNKFFLALYKRWAIRSIDFAIEKKQNIHFWIHPFDFARYPKLYDVVAAIIKYASEKQDLQLLKILRMKDLVKTSGKKCYIKEEDDKKNT